MTEEFNLSEKIEGLEIADGTEIMIKAIRIEYVKEFIKRLRREIIENEKIEDYQLSIINNIIDKFAGDELK
jgi:uncharacterized protein YbcI